MLTFNLKTTFFTVKTSNEVYCCRIYFVNYIQNVHIINRTLHGSLEDMDFMFSWQEQYLTRSLRSLVRYCSCHSNIKSISSRNRVISYISYRCGIGNPYRAASIHYYQRVVHVRVVYIIFGSFNTQLLVIISIFREPNTLRRLSYASTLHMCYCSE